MKEQRTMALLAKASHGRTAPKAKNKMAVSDLFMNKSAANAQDEHLLQLLAQGDIDAYGLLTSGDSNFTLLTVTD